MSDDGSDEAGYRVILFHFLGFLFCPGCRCFHTRQALEHVSRCCAVSGSGLPHTLHTLRSPMGNAAMMVSSFTGFTSLADSSVTPCNDLSLFFSTVSGIVSSPSCPSPSDSSRRLPIHRSHGCDASCPVSQLRPTHRTGRILISPGTSRMWITPLLILRDP